MSQASYPRIIWVSTQMELVQNSIASLLNELSSSLYKLGNFVEVSSSLSIQFANMLSSSIRGLFPNMFVNIFTSLSYQILSTNMFANGLTILPIELRVFTEYYRVFHELKSRFLLPKNSISNFTSSS